MENKVCIKCGLNKDINGFNIQKNKYYRSICILCEKEYNKSYRENNKEKLAIQKKEWYLVNLENNKEKRQIYYLENKEDIKNKSNEYRILNKIKIKKNKKEDYIKNKTKIINQHNAYIKQRKKIDPLFKLKVNIRSTIYNNLKRGNYNKTLKTNDILGCTYKELKEYLEAKFEGWMSWDNYGLYNGTLNYGWDIDHIIPTSIAISEYELLNLSHFNNLQPLCSKINRDIKKNYILWKN